MATTSASSDAPSSSDYTSTPYNGNWAGNTAPSEIVDNVRRHYPTAEVNANGKRFLPAIYGGRPEPTKAPVKRNTDSKRTDEEPTYPAGGDSNITIGGGETTADGTASTITSTATVTGTCAAVAGSTTDSADWAG